METLCVHRLVLYFLEPCTEKWRGALGDRKPRDVWRLECLFSGKFVKERNTRRPHELEAARPHLIAEALHTRRLIAPNFGDENHWRWPLHPLWSEAYRARSAAEMLPLGRKITGRRVVLVDRAEKQITGVIRSATVLPFGAYDEPKVKLLAKRAYVIDTIQ